MLRFQRFLRSWSLGAPSKVGTSETTESLTTTGHCVRLPPAPPPSATVTVLLLARPPPVRPERFALASKCLFRADVQSLGAASRPPSAFDNVQLIALCSIHGADVTQTVHALLVSGELSARVTKLDVLCLLIASASHDVGAPARYL